MMYSVEYMRDRVAWLRETMVFVQEPDCDGTWLEAAWDDEHTASDPDGWDAEVERVRKLVAGNHYEMRIFEVDVPGIYEAFELPRVTAKSVEERTER